MYFWKKRLRISPINVCDSFFGKLLKGCVLAISDVLDVIKCMCVCVPVSWEYVYFFLAFPPSFLPPFPLIDPWKTAKPGGHYPVQGKAKSELRECLRCKWPHPSLPHPWQYIPLLYCLQWEQFMELGKDMADSEVEKILQEQKPQDCALLIYTVREVVTTKPSNPQ